MVMIKMSENKRFIIYEHKDNDYILDTPNTSLDFIEMLGNALSSEEIVNLLNEQDNRIKELENENKQLKIQLQTDDICSKCKHEYLVKQDDGYFIAKCKKAFSECSTGDVTYCKDFELKDNSDMK